MLEREEIYSFIESSNLTTISSEQQNDIKRCIKNVDLMIEILQSKFHNISHIHIISILCDCMVLVDKVEQGLLPYLFTDNVDLRCPAIQKRIINEINNGYIYNDLFEDPSF